MDLLKIVLERVNNAVAALIGVSTQNEPNEWNNPEDYEEEEEEDLVEDVYYQPENNTEEEDIVNNLMESWNQLYAHVNEKTPSLNDINSQFLVSKFALQTVKHLDHALYVVAGNVCESEGYASPPPWAIKIARGALIEYLTGTLTMIRTCMEDHHGIEEDIDEEHLED